jgi:hypothetical protein
MNTHPEFVRPEKITIEKNINQKLVIKQKLEMIRAHIEERFQKSIVNNYTFNRRYNDGFISKQGLKPKIKGFQQSPSKVSRN